MARNTFRQGMLVTRGENRPKRRHAGKRGDGNELVQASHVDHKRNRQLFGLFAHNKHSKLQSEGGVGLLPIAGKKRSYLYIL